MQDIGPPKAGLDTPGLESQLDHSQLTLSHCAKFICFSNKCCNKVFSPLEFIKMEDWLLDPQL